MENVPAYVNLLSALFVVVSMLSVALETPHRQIVGTLRDWRLMGGAVLAHLILAPVLGVILVRWLDLPAGHQDRLPDARARAGRALRPAMRPPLAGNRVCAVGLLIVLSMVAVVVTPVLIALCFPTVEAGQVPFVWLLLLSLLLLAAPLLAGRAFQQLTPAGAPKLGGLLGGLAIVLFIITALITGKDKMPAITSIGTHGIVAIIAFTLGSWAIDWLLGGPEVRNRQVLAISTSMRNVGGCVPIAANSFPSTAVVVPPLACSGMSIPMHMRFVLIMGRMLRDTEARARPVEA